MFKSLPLKKEDLKTDASTAVKCDPSTRASGIHRRIPVTLTEIKVMAVHFRAIL